MTHYRRFTYGQCYARYKKCVKEAGGPINALIQGNTFDVALNGELRVLIGSIGAGMAFGAATGVVTGGIGTLLVAGVSAYSASVDIEYANAEGKECSDMFKQCTACTTD